MRLLLLLLAVVLLVNVGCCAFGGLNEYEPPDISFGPTDDIGQHNEGWSSDV